MIRGYGPYWYEVESEMTPAGPRQRHIRYIGKLWGYKSSSRLKAEGTPEEIRQYIESYRRPLIETVYGLRRTFKPEKARATGRLKQAASIEEKMQRKQYPLSRIQDVAGTRVSFKSIEQEKAAVQKIREHYNVVKVDNFLSEKRPDGYRGIHVDIDYEGRPVEVQLRTRRQDRWADWSHEYVYERYAKKGAAPPDELVNYARAMSDYYYELDSGRKASKPSMHESLKETGVKEM